MPTTGRDWLAALARRRRSDQGGRRLASITLIKAIEGLALERPPLPISSIHRQASLIPEALPERNSQLCGRIPYRAQHVALQTVRLQASLFPHPMHSVLVRDLSVVKRSLSGI